jgi:hypothetical protein
MSSFAINIPTCKWAQRKDCVFITVVDIPDAKDEVIAIEDNKLIFKAVSQGKHYECEMILHASINIEGSKCRTTARNIQFCLEKFDKKAGIWPRLLKDKGLNKRFCKVDFGRWVEEDEEKDTDTIDTSRMHEIPSIGSRSSGKVGIGTSDILYPFNLPPGPCRKHFVPLCNVNDVIQLSITSRTFLKYLREVEAFVFLYRRDIYDINIGDSEVKGTSSSFPESSTCEARLRRLVIHTSFQRALQSERSWIHPDMRDRLISFGMQQKFEGPEPKEGESPYLVGFPGEFYTKVGPTFRKGLTRCPVIVHGIEEGRFKKYNGSAGHRESWNQIKKKYAVRIGSKKKKKGRVIFVEPRNLLYKRMNKIGCKLCSTPLLQVTTIAGTAEHCPGFNYNFDGFACARCLHEYCHECAENNSHFPHWLSRTQRRNPGNFQLDWGTGEFYCDCIDSDVNGKRVFFCSSCESPNYDSLIGYGNDEGAEACLHFKNGPTPADLLHMGWPDDKEIPRDGSLDYSMDYSPLPHLSDMGLGVDEPSECLACDQLICSSCSWDSTWTPEGREGRVQLCPTCFEDEDVKNDIKKQYFTSSEDDEEEESGEEESDPED